MALDKDALLAAIDAAKENSYGTDEQSSLGAARQKAINAYFGLNTNPAPEGRSQVVDRAVYETIQTQLPSLVKIFAGSSDEVCKATPIGPDDEQAAEQHTAVLNYIVTQQNNWEQTCADWLHDALLLNNGYCMAYWDEAENLVQETYEDQSEDQVAALLQDKRITVLQHSEKQDDEATEEAMAQWQQMAQQAQMQGMEPPPPPGPVFLHDLVIERREHEGKVCIKVLAPEHCYVSADTPDWTLKECPYFEFKQEKPLADLRAMGLDVPDDINDNEDEDPEDDARDRFDEDRLFNEGLGAMRRVWTRSIWVRADAEGDGRSRLYYVIAVGRNILFCQQVARIPVASMTSQPLPHRHIGMSEAEIVLDIQEIQTVIKRGGLDNLYLMNAGRNAVSSKVNLEDFLDARPGGVVRMLDDSLPAEGHIMPLVHPVAFDSIIGTLEYFDQSRQNRTGASRYFSGTDANAINKTASGTIALQNMASMRVEHKARMMAPAVEELFSCVQEIMQKHANKAMTIKLRAGKWVTVDPQAWRTKRDLRISVGVGAGNKESMAAQLQGQLGAQLQLMPLGIAGPEQIHATVVELAKLGGFANPDRFWLNPATQPPRPPQPTPDQIKSQTTIQVEQMRLQADAQKFQAEKQFRLQEIQATTDAKLREVQASLELQWANDARDSEREQQNAAATNALERARIELEQWKTQVQAALDKYKADQDTSTKLQIAGLKAETDLTSDLLQAEADQMARDDEATQAEAERQHESEETARQEAMARQEKEQLDAQQAEEDEMKAQEALDRVSLALDRVIEMQRQMNETQKKLLKEVNRPRVPIKDESGKTIGSRPAKDGEF
jgi:hypothetical protein